MRSMFEKLRTISWQQAIVLVALIASVAFTAHALPERLWNKILDSSPETIAGWITTVGLALMALAAQARRELPAVVPPPAQETIPPAPEGFVPPAATPGPPKIPREAAGYRDDAGAEEREDETPRLGARGRDRERGAVSVRLLLTAVAVLALVAAAAAVWGSR